MPTVILLLLRGHLRSIAKFTRLSLQWIQYSSRQSAIQPNRSTGRRLAPRVVLTVGSAHNTWVPPEQKLYAEDDTDVKDTAAAEALLPSRQRHDLLLFS